MAQVLHTQIIWILKLVVICLRSPHVSSENANWEKQFTAIKTMMTALDAKVSSMDSRLSNLNVLEYAFKMNTMDNNIRTLNTRVDQIFSQLDTIKDTLKNLPSSTCPQPRETQSLQQPRGSSDVAKEVDLALKLDDYGKKLIQAQKDIKTASEQHHQSLLGFFEVVRSGFTKVVSKVESLLTLEGQMSTITPLVRQLSTTTNFISDEVSNAVADITDMKKSVANFVNVATDIAEVKRSASSFANAAKDITEIKGKVSDFSDASKAFSEIVTDVKSSISVPASQLGVVVDQAKELQSQMLRLTSVEKKVIEAASISSELLTKDSVKSLPAEDMEMAQKIRKSLLEIENVTLPLFVSAPYALENIRAIVGDAFTTLANKTQCSSDKTVVLEISRLRESIAKRNFDNSPDDLFDYCRNSIQDLVVKGTPDIKIALMKLLSHLKILVDINGKQNPGDEPLRSLLG